jgi:hypothetical protein
MLIIRTITPHEDAVIVNGRGKRKLSTLQAIETRDRRLIEAAATYFHGWSALAAANKLHREIARYREGGWRRERTDDQCPTRLCGRIEASCWHVLRARDAVPSIRLIRRALAAK